MGMRRKYRKKQNHYVVAIRLNLETDGFTYRKWGDVQTCKQGDWLVDNDGDVYTVNAEVFARTYRNLSPGIFIKSTPVWAEVALVAGRMVTNEGTSQYDRGDYIVFNNEDGSDAYCMSAKKFESMYEPDEE
jgi:hypothetical protein